MKVLLTGANGYIGRRLKQALLDENVSLRLLVRNPKSLDPDLGVEVAKGDTFDPASLERALEGVDVAYYLIHSLQHKNYKELDRQSAQNFLDAAIKQGVKRIIYLGGLGVKEHASEHLLSRIETGEVLSSQPDKIETIWIRAGVIIGSGSSSFEIIRHLTEKLPVMVTPKWVKTLAQPIGVDDVIAYLNASKDLDVKGNLIVDIGSEKMTYREMMLGCANALGLKRWIFPLPILTINLSSYWLNLFTPVPYTVARSLIEGLSSEVVIQNDHAKQYFPQIHPIGFEAAVKRAIQRMEENQVFSRWSDAGGEHDMWERQHKDDPSSSVLMDRQTMKLNGIPKENVYQTFCSIGGKEGWFGYDWLWELRGWMDKMLGGAGLNRGRRDTHKLRIGESVDFWRVEDLAINERLLLYAQMKVPGKAWLEFKIKEDELVQTAYFYPKGVWGRLYWYSLTPIHYLVFRNMIESILNKAKTINRQNRTIKPL
ncbi:MAG: Putative nucleoside-diphosphate-sugar epimerase [uncultured Sulfurovum sp.]|uniref:Nucleoside-diphosphate-sugar epimerase n=1 Tax=uncultured Sulfurovum sp. TaxID=269237 RepID=A0A6S6U339_9BACT|nr:MAG: Putative nucleoside-diphosphate-sugar epimerase [uncultured Sulfurovum sp.]